MVQIEMKELTTYLGLCLPNTGDHDKSRIKVAYYQKE